MLSDMGDESVGWAGGWGLGLLSCHAECSFQNREDFFNFSRVAESGDPRRAQAIGRVMCGGSKNGSWMLVFVLTRSRCWLWLVLGAGVGGWWQWWHALVDGGDGGSWWQAENLKNLRRGNKKGLVFVAGLLAKPLAHGVAGHGWPALASSGRFGNLFVTNWD
jgi:hypothetical protein